MKPHNIPLEPWETKARQMFPDLLLFDRGKYVGIYGTFIELCVRCSAAHKRGDTAELERIYAFAEWCVDQEEYDIYNAAAVSFYEHLVDDTDVISTIPKWVRPDIFWALSTLFETRIGHVNYEELRREYVHRNGPPQHNRQ